MWVQGMTLSGLTPVAYEYLFAATHMSAVIVDAWFCYGHEFLLDRLSMFRARCWIQPV